MPPAILIIETPRQVANRTASVLAAVTRAISGPGWVNSYKNLPGPEAEAKARHKYNQRSITERCSTKKAIVRFVII